LPIRTLFIEVCDNANPQVGSRIPDAVARRVLERCREAFIEAERLIPGVSSAFVLEIVENVEQVDEHD